MIGRYHDRTEAGRRLAKALSRYADRSDVLVLALPRGGVPVGAEVARALRAPLDVFIVRKLGVPAHPELAMGALASGGVRVIDPSMMEQFGVTEARWNQGAGWVFHLPRIVGLGNAMEIVVWCDKRISAQRAYEMGLVNKVVPGDQLMDEALDWGRRLLELAPRTLRLNQNPNAEFEEDLPCFERDLQHMVTKERG